MRIMHLKSLASLAVLLGLACEAAAQPYRTLETGVYEEDAQPFAGFERAIRLRSGLACQGQQHGQRCQ